MPRHSRQRGARYRLAAPGASRHLRRAGGAHAVDGATFARRGDAHIRGSGTLGTHRVGLFQSNNRSPAATAQGSIRGNAMSASSRRHVCVLRVQRPDLFAARSRVLPTRSRRPPRRRPTGRTPGDRRRTRRGRRGRPVARRSGCQCCRSARPAHLSRTAASRTCSRSRRSRERPPLRTAEPMIGQWSSWSAAQVVARHPGRGLGLRSP